MSHYEVQQTKDFKGKFSGMVKEIRRNERYWEARRHIFTEYFFKLELIFPDITVLASACLQSFKQAFLMYVLHSSFAQAWINKLSNILVRVVAYFAK